MQFLNINQHSAHGHERGEIIEPRAQLSQERVLRPIHGELRHLQLCQILQAVRQHHARTRHSPIITLLCSHHHFFLLFLELHVHVAYAALLKLQAAE